MRTAFLPWFLFLVFFLSGCAGPVLDLPEPTALQLADARFVLAQAQLSPAPKPITDHVEATNPTALRIQEAVARVCPRLQMGGCDKLLNGPVLVIHDPETINAYADQHDRITVYTGLIDRLGVDSELAGVLAHEYAHVMLGHVDKKQTNMFTGAVLLSGLVGVLAAANNANLDPQVYSDMAQLGGLVGSRAYSPEMELEADRLAVYILSEAGYSILAMRDALIRLHRVQATARSSGLAARVGFLETHPSDDRRIAHVLTAMDDVVSGIPWRVKKENIVEEADFEED